MEAYYSIIEKENEYRILLTPVNTVGLPVHIQQILSNRKIDISELIIERINGESATGQEVLHDITGWIAEMFARNPNLIIYYSCDDMTPIPSRNKSGENKDIPVNEYRSRLFSHIFDTYISSHQVLGVCNTPIRLDNYVDGIGYSLFFHFIARDIHSDIVEMLKADIKDVSGK